jgi:hypothetical protein
VENKTLGIVVVDSMVLIFVVILAAFGGIAATVDATVVITAINA